MGVNYHLNNHRATHSIAMNSIAAERDIFLSLCISMKSGWYIKGYHLGNIFS